MEILSRLHPFVVHFPIAFFVLYFILETTGAVLKKEYFIKTALLVFALGVLTALLAVLTGNLAHEAVKNILDGGSKELDMLINRHENAATWSLWYFTILFFLRIYLTVKKKFNNKYVYLFILLGAIGCVLVIYAGYYGGVLVFEHGIGTELFK